ncbi:MAG: 4-(cytidine 5'-diphospho)-2-C-methyl-D-erythritol kinase, partial [Dongiaceae bacterium]
MSDAFRVAAPAKLNLYLHVVGRRDDGYHLLDSLAAFAAVGDELTFAPAPD